MNDIFSFNRVLKLIKIHLIENWKMYAASVGILAIIVFLLPSMGGNPEKYLTYIIRETYPVIMIGVLCLFTGNIFGTWTKESKAIFYINIPATAFEKFLSKLVLIILYFPVFTFSFFLLVYIIGNIFMKTPFNVSRMMDLGFIKAFEGTGSIRFLYITFLLQPLYLLGALYFKKYQVVFSSVALIGIFILLFFLPHSFLSYHPYRTSLNIWPDSITASYMKSGAQQSLNIGFKTWLVALNTLIYVLASLALYVAAFFKLKEKEI